MQLILDHFKIILRHRAPIIVQIANPLTWVSFIDLSYMQVIVFRIDEHTDVIN